MATNTESGYDFSYLKDTVGTPLTQALAQLALEQPEDPVDFVANYLLKHVANVKRQAEIIQYKKQQEDWEEERAEKKRIAAMNADVKELQIIQRTESISKAKIQMGKAATYEELNKLLVGALKDYVGATSVSIGRRLVDSEGAQKVYWFATSTNSAALDKFVSEEEGVTFDVFKEIEPENTEPDEDGNVPVPKPPEYIHIPNVIREPRMVFYGVPKLGAYAAKGIAYKQYLHDEVTQEGEPGVINSRDCSLVVAADTVGTAKPFTDAELSSFAEWGTCYGESAEALEKRIFDKEIPEKRNEEAAAPDLLSKIKEKVEANEERITTAIENIAEEEQALKGAEIRLTLTTEIILAYLDEIEKLAQFQIPYKLPVLYAISSALSVLGTAKSKLLNRASGLPDWEKIRKFLQPSSLQTQLELFNPSVSVAEAKQLLENTSVDQVEPLCPVASCMLLWAQAAVAASEAITEAALAAAATEE